ncbi:MAG: hypothetical protein ACRD0G_14330 [Acidimicrobiales bacterium]
MTTAVTSRVTLVPDAFSLVEFDAAELIGVVERVLDAVGIDDPVRLEIDETTPLGWARVVSSDPIVLELESGALEDPKRLLHLSPTGAAAVLGRLLSRVRDRRDPVFCDPVAPPPDRELSLAQSSAWDAYGCGRLVRLGFRHHDDRERRRYHFRIRHGFTDASDVAFDALWAGEGLTWADIERLSAAASPEPSRGTATDSSEHVVG